MERLTLMHVNVTTGVEQRVNVETEDVDNLTRLFNAFADDDPAFGTYGSLHFKVPFGTISIIPFEEEQ